MGTNAFDLGTQGSQYLEERLCQDWWKKLFNHNYLLTDGDVVENPANTDRDIDILLEMTGLLPDQKVLDLCCGQGRHCQELYRRGYKNITGLDYSCYLLDVARGRAKESGMDIVFVESDARFPPLPSETFDAVICMGNSFGYFPAVNEDFCVIRAVHSLLKPGGIFFLDLSDGERVRQTFQRHSREWINARTWVSRERGLDRDGRRLITREIITSLDQGTQADQVYAETLYSGEEISRMLTQGGFEVAGCSLDRCVESTRNEDLGMLEHRMIVKAFKV